MNFITKYAGHTHTIYSTEVTGYCTEDNNMDEQ